MARVKARRPEAGQAALLSLLARREDSPHSGRIVCSSRRNPGEQVAEGRFREDLHYRLNELTIAIPPLRERREDIPVLAEWILKDAAFRAGQTAKALSGEVESLFERHHWPGNVRQLRNIVEYAAVVCTKAIIQREHLPVGFPASVRQEKPGPAPAKTEDAGRLEILEALRVTRWHKTKAAELLGISRSTFYRRMGELGIARRA